MPSHEKHYDFYKRLFGGRFFVDERMAREIDSFLDNQRPHKRFHNMKGVEYCSKIWNVKGRLYACAHIFLDHVAENLDFWVRWLKEEVKRVEKEKFKRKLLEKWREKQKRAVIRRALKYLLE